MSKSVLNLGWVFLHQFLYETDFAVSNYNSFSIAGPFGSTRIPYSFSW